LLFADVTASIETRHPFPAAFLERRNERPLGFGIARALAREEIGRGNLLGEEPVAASLDEEPRAARILAPGQRQDHPAAILEPVEPEIDRPRHAGVDIDDIGRVEIDLGTIAMHSTHVGLADEIRHQTPGEAGSYSIAVTRPLSPTMCARIAV
jgi:hypothetical protein